MNEVVRKLLQLSQESIRGARVLLKEDLPGQAASRAYYAMFYVAQALLITRGLSFSRHSAVISRFGKEFSKTRLFDPKYHKYLIDGFEKRQIADYAITEDIDNDTATELIDHAAQFLEEAGTFIRNDT